MSYRVCHVNVSVSYVFPPLKELRYLLIDFKVDAIQLTQTNQIGTNQDTQFLALCFTLLAITRMTLMLQSNPQLVHFCKIGQDKVDGFKHIAFGSVTVDKYNLIQMQAKRLTQSPHPRVNDHGSCY